MYKYPVITEKGDDNYSAYSPDLPGCVATSKSPQEVKENMPSAIELPLAGLADDNLAIPESNALADYVAVA